MVLARRSHPERIVERKIVAIRQYQPLMRETRARDEDTA